MPPHDHRHRDRGPTRPPRDRDHHHSPRHSDHFRRHVLDALRRGRITIINNNTVVNQNVNNTNVNTTVVSPPFVAPNVPVFNPYAMPFGGGGGSYSVSFPPLPPPGPLPDPVVVVPDNPDQPRGPAVGLGVTTPRAAAGATADGEEEKEPLQTTRTIRLHNTTAEPVTVYVQYRAFDEEGALAWHPGEPDGDQNRALKVEVPAKDSVEVMDGDWVVHATRARIWARNKSTRWERFRDTNLPIVPEVNERGEGGYRMASPEAFIFTLR